MAQPNAKRARAKAKLPSIAVRKACFLEVLRQTGIVSRAAREAGVPSSTLYAHRARNKGFAADWDAAMAQALDELEAVLLERARDGTEKPVLFQGKVVSSVRSYSDALAMFLLKAKRPEVYDRIGGGSGAMVTVSAYEVLSEEDARGEVRKRLDRLAEHEDGA
ncbi:hypothetical protein [Sphingomonas japonica]|uniref:Transposase-like protein n=1 Tax=Sphingomonas japonica TaxID=511662 RepID=A0ABX0TZH1_9SPHN|nr:hypothetical protein [Sphingomonas japonica]NIJ23720.1 transposase-like protein [Sphingomonas japonica]